MDKTGHAGSQNERALLNLMEKTGYNVIQENGQRKYGGPPPNWEGPPPARGCEIFVGKIPRDAFEDELVPIFEKIGKLYELRLMIDFSGTNRGYAFVMYCDKEDAKRAVKELNNYEIRRGKLLGVCPSVDNCRLFVGGIPKDKTKEDIMTEMKKVTEGVTDVIVYPSALDKTKNRGFAFIEYENHRAAAVARRKMIPGRIQLWGYHVAVDWAEPEIEIDEDVMSKVRILYVRNLMVFTTEETIKKAFIEACGYSGESGIKECPVERVKKIKDYAFVHFNDRNMALKALDAINGKKIDGAIVEVVLAKPVDKMEYWRYARNKMGITQAQRSGMIGPAGDAMFAMQGGIARGRSSVGARGMVRGRGRKAAGARAVGAKPPMFPPMGMMRPGFPRYAPEVLDEICSKNGWGMPEYILHSTISREANQDVQLFVYKISIPAMIAAGAAPFQSNKLSTTVEEAKMIAAEVALISIGIPINGPKLYPGDHMGMPHPGMSIATIPNMASQPHLDLMYANSMMKMPPAQQGTNLYTGQPIMVAAPSIPYQNGYPSHPPPDLTSITTSMSKLLSPTQMQDQCYPTGPPPQVAPPTYSTAPPTLTSMPPSVGQF